MTYPDKREAPVSWQRLLDDAIAKPGILSACFQLFHNFSIGNQMLAYWQLCERGLEAGPLATFKGWKAKGRAVRRGERGIVLCMPIIAKKEDANGNEKKVAFFVYKALWFAYSQTEAIPGLEDTHKAEKAPEGWDAGLALKALRIEEKAYDMIDGNCQRYAKGRSVAINPMAAHPTKTLIHELAHIVLGHTGQNDWNPGHTAESRSLREVEAETV
jgi:antirestriction protein ArdC